MRPGVRGFCRAMLTTVRIDAGIFQSEPLHWSPAHNVRFHNLVDIGHGHAAIPDSFGINHHIGPVLALVEAAGLVRAYSSLQPPLCQFLLESLLQLGLADGIATSSRMSGRTDVSAHKNVALELGHRNYRNRDGLQELAIGLVFQRHQQLFTAAKRGHALDRAAAIGHVHYRAITVDSMSGAGKVPDSPLVGSLCSLLDKMGLLQRWLLGQR